MSSTSRWIAFALFTPLALGSAACGDDESAEGGGSGGGETTSASSGSPTSSSSGSANGSSGATTSSSTGGLGECPEFQPAMGSACTPVEGTCSYSQEAVCPDGGFTNATALAACSGGIWMLTYESSGECCPEVLTESGAIGCAIEGTICTYEGEAVCDDGGSIGGGITATCDGDRWQTLYEPTGGVCEGESICPAEPPLSSSECDPAVDSTTCIWEEASPCPDGPGFNVITVAKCNAGFGQWAVGTIFEGTQCAACDDEPGSCPINGMACVQTNDCDDVDGTIVSGTVCEKLMPYVKWSIATCEG